ncbi:MAG TPA: ABC transporter permease [Anaerolineae bacterium]
MRYIANNPDVVLTLLWEHLSMTAIALLIATAIALPLGMLIARDKRLATPVLGILGMLYTIPSIALMIFLLPFFGLNRRSVIVALVIYTQIILVRNIVAGLEAIDPAILEAARGMGMNGWQRWWRVQLPLALPVVLAGERIATVVATAIATIGAKFNGGGLGVLLFDGIAQNRYDKILAGSIVVALLALALNRGLLALEQYFDTSERIRRAEKRQSPTAEPSAQSA